MNKMIKCSVWMALVLMAASTAQAGTEPPACETDSDCDKGFACGPLSTRNDCAMSPPCSSDGECPEPEPCDLQVIMGCVPGSCESDADCGDSMVCLIDVHEACVTGETPGCMGEDCEPLPKDDEMGCVIVDRSQCVPKWAAPCTESADCGAGFDCVEQEQCWCEGSTSGSAGGSGGGADCEGEACIDGGVPEDGKPEPLPEPKCGCDPSGEFYCELKEVTCSADSDCDADLVCGDNPNRATCSTTSSGGTDSGGDGDGEPVPAGDEMPAVEELPADEEGCGTDDDTPAQICMPTDYSNFGFGYAEEGRQSAGLSEIADSGGTNPTAATDAKGTSDGESDNDATSKTEDGCSVASGPAAAGQALWLLLAAAFLARRRRY